MSKATELSQAIANAWEEIHPLVSEKDHEFERSLTLLLRRLEAAQGRNDQEIVDAIHELFRKYPEANNRLIRSLEQITAHLKKGTGMPAGVTHMDRYVVVPVFFGTDREQIDSSDPKERYGSGRGQLNFGVADVSVSDDHRMGELEKPTLWKLQFRDDPQKHVSMLGIVPLTESEFVDKARATIGRGDKNEVLVFIHGYYTNFEDAIRRTAQIAYDLHFEGLAVLYSWPSEGSVDQYTVDETNVEWSQPDFQMFLGILRERLGVDCVHIIAHSMGNRAVADALEHQVGSKDGARLSQVILAAPDIDAETFKGLAKTFTDQAKRISLYASSKDKALMASRKVHKYPRAGETSPNLVIVDKIDTIDASEVDTSFLGHSYFAENRSVVTDIFYLVRNGMAPIDRGLTRKEMYGKPYWIFSP